MVPISRPLDALIAAIAGKQYGVIALWQLVELGITESGVRKRVATGRLHRIHRGVYAVGHPLLSKRGWWMAGILACGPGAVLSHTSAGELHGIAKGRGIHVASPTRSRHGIPKLTLHQPRGLAPDEVTVIDGIPVTSVTRTLVDLAAILDYDQLKRAWQAAQRLHLLDVDAVKPYLDQPRRGIRNLRALVDNAIDAPDTKGEFEARFDDLIVEEGITRPAYNVLIEGFLVDAVWIDEKLIVELDSREYHWYRVEEDAERRAELMLGDWRVYNVTWRALTKTPETVAARIRRLLRTAPSPTPAARADAA